MIRLRNKGDQVAVLRVGGTLTTTSTDIWGPAPFTGQIRGVYALLGTAGTTNTMTVDLLKNGVSVVGSGTLLSFATTATTPTYGTLTTNPITVAKGDLFKLSVTAVHSTPAVDLYVGILFEKIRDGAQIAAMATQSYDGGV